MRTTCLKSHNIVYGELNHSKQHVIKERVSGITEVLQSGKDSEVIVTKWRDSEVPQAAQECCPQGRLSTCVCLKQRNSRERI